MPETAPWKSHLYFKDHVYEHWNVLRFPCLPWQALYHAALFENDRHKVPQRIEEAEKAIVSRIRELFVTTTDHIEEDVVLDDALYALRALRSCVHSEAAAA